MSEPFSLESMSDICKDILHMGEEPGGMEEGEATPAVQGGDIFEDLLTAEKYDAVLSETDKLLAEIPPLR